MHIEKVIPAEAGLAGGSADCAAVLQALNTLYETAMEPDELCSIGKTLGADVPFCLHQGAAAVQGVGEIITPCATLPPCHLLIAQGDVPVSTPAAFAALDSVDRQVRIGNPMTALLESGDLPAICQGLYNAFECIVPSSRPLKEKLLEMGAMGALMSGSGSAVYAVFSSRKTAETAKEALHATGRRAWVCDV